MEQLFLRKVSLPFGFTGCVFQKVQWIDNDGDDIAFVDAKEYLKILCHTCQLAFEIIN
jgi:hypothetical protein